MQTVPPKVRKIGRFPLRPVEIFPQPSPQRPPRRVTALVTRRVYGLIAGALVFGVIAFAIGHFLGQADSKHQLAELRAQLADAHKDQEAKAAQLAPFLTLANQRFTSAPEAQRLTLLKENWESSEAAPKPLPNRILDTDAIRRIYAILEITPRREIEVGGVFGNAESLALAEELRILFKESGFTVSEVQQYAPPKPIHGVVVISKKPLDSTLEKAFLQLFTALGQSPKLELASKMPAEKVQIVVGEK